MKKLNDCWLQKRTAAAAEGNAAAMSRQMAVKMAMWRLLVVLAALSATASSQARVGAPRVRLAEWLSYSLCDRKVLPDVSDLKGQRLSTEVVLAIMISKTGDVTHAHALKGNPALFKRSEDAALKWHYKPFVLYGAPIEADTMVRFRFEGSTVKVVVPPRTQ